MPRKISFINYKGGVGKTSTLVNVAASLAERGRRVLLFDLDTQSNSSVWLMRLERWNKLNQSASGGFIYDIFDPGTQTIADIVQKSVVVDKDGKKLLPNLDLVPTNFNLIDLEQEYKPDPAKPHFVKFHEQLVEIEGQYDYIFFDCPPNILRAAQLALFNSNEVYVPSNPDALSLIGFTLLVSKLAKFNEQSAGYRVAGMGPPASVYGIIFNAIKANMDIKVPKMRVQFSLNQFRTQKKVHPNARILNAEVRDAVVVRRAVTLGLPVCLIGQAVEDDGVLQDYRAVGREIEQFE
jgi:chromosome partitioning protein